MSNADQLTATDVTTCVTVVVFVFAMPLSFVLARLMVLLFRLAVKRAMARRAGVYFPHDSAERPAAIPGKLHIDVTSEAAPATPLARAMLDAAMRLPVRTAIAYTLGGLAAALLLGFIAPFTVENAGPLTPRTYALYFFLRTWAVVPAIFIIAVPRRLPRLVIIPIVGILYVAIAELLGADETTAVAHFLPSLALVAVAGRSLKTAGPILWIVLSLILLGPSIGVLVLGWVVMDPIWGWIASILTMVLFAVGAVVALGWIARLHERKAISDLAFYLDAYWFLWIFLSSITPSAPSWHAPVAFIAYKLVSSRAVAVLVRRPRRPPTARLLLLRVFGSRGRSERLMEQLATRWRYIGPIHLIAGTDLATANLDPAELWAFLTFRFRRLYVADQDDLARRLEHLDCAPDRDGRYRVNDFFCFDDTWKTTVQSLIDASDVVLLDARGFTAGKAGVAFELTRLMRAGRIGDTVIAVDETTDETALRNALDLAWCAAAEREEATVRLFRVKGARAAEHLVVALCNALTAPAPAPDH